MIRIVSLFFFLELLVCSEPVTREQVIMGTFAFVTVDKPNAKVADTVFSRMKSVEHSLSSFKENGGVYRLNQYRSIIADDELIEAIKLSKKFFSDTLGYFDITIGSITKQLYRFGTKDSKIPEQIEVKQAKIGLDKIHLEGRRVTIEPGIFIDLGGMGKGFAIDKAAEELLKRGVKWGIIGLSGDIKCIGSCNVSIQNPFGEGTIAQITSNAEQTAISTSGNYRRYVGSKRYSHLIDPKLKRSERYFASVTLFGKLSNATLDAYATAVTVMPPEMALRFLQRHSDIGYLLVASNGMILRKSESIKLFSKIGFVLHPSLDIKVKVRLLQKGLQE